MEKEEESINNLNNKKMRWVPINQSSLPCEMSQTLSFATFQRNSRTEIHMDKGFSKLFK